MVAELLNKYIWLIQIFKQAGNYGLSLQEILDKWEDKWGESYSRRSFNNHRAAIEEVFSIKIECRRSTNRYYVKYSEDISDQEDTTSWIINTFSVNNMMSLSRERLSGRVSIENVPSGHRWLVTVLDAMQTNRILIVSYRKYNRQESSYHIRPYAVKEDDRRWYLIGFCEERKELRVYGLDRITAIEMTDKTFTMLPDFNVDELFATCYSIYLGDGKARTIRFRAFGTEVMYLRDLPIHHSQKETVTEENYSDFEIFVAPDDKMIMDFCSRGGRIEVLAPEEVREKVVTTLKEGLERYE